MTIMYPGSIIPIMEVTVNQPYRLFGKEDIMTQQRYILISISPEQCNRSQAVLAPAEE